MPRSAAVTVENNFINGLVTEATALNFPEAACTETLNCVFNKDGSFERRPGIDFEAQADFLVTDRQGKATNTYVWYNAAGSGNYNFVVTQIGYTLYFYEIDSDSLSGGRLVSTIDVSTFLAAGAPTSAVETECQFAAGKGYLFVSHLHCDPFFVSYDIDLNTMSAEVISLQIRDTAGLDDGLATDDRPSTLSDEHQYNLYNQGWAPFSTGGLNDPRPINAYPELIRIQPNLPTSYDGGDPLATWIANRSDHPSNADIWWMYKDAYEVFQPKLASTANRGNSPAPRGHYILDAFNQDRSTASGIAGFSVVTSSYYRPRTIAFFAGRVWYGGVDYQGFSNRLYFSQIVTQDSLHFGRCYQENDPPSETSFDILATDGGTIQILDCGSIYRMVALSTSLIIFATNGVWSISGSTGTGFTPTDFAVSKLSSLPTLSASSFVDVAGMPAWWTSDGIYVIANAGQNGGVSLTSLSEKKIKDYFVNEVPAESKRFAKGYFNPLSKVVQWLYRSTTPESVEQRNEYDSILCFDTVTQAFYVWQIDNPNVRLNGIVSIQGYASSNTADTVQAETVEVQVGGDTVTVAVFSDIQQAGIFKYLVSYSSGGTSFITFAEAYNTDYLDFYSYNSEGYDYESYLVSGYKVRGDAQKKFQSNYVILFMDMEVFGIFDFGAIWDYAILDSTGDYGSLQRIDTTSVTGRKYKFRRLKVRGSGLSVQFKISSLSGEPFKIVGWSTFDTANQAV